MASNKKISYTATFADGTVITRKSHREYTHAWRLIYTIDMTGPEWKSYHESLRTIHDCSSTGFSATEALARKAARCTADPKYISNVRVEIVPVAAA